MDLTLGAMLAIAGGLVLVGWRRRRARGRRQAALAELGFWAFRMRGGWQWGWSTFKVLRTVPCHCGCGGQTVAFVQYPLWVWRSRRAEHLIPLTPRGTVRCEEN